MTISNSVISGNGIPAPGESRGRRHLCRRRGITDDHGQHRYRQLGESVRPRHWRFGRRHIFGTGGLSINACLIANNTASDSGFLFRRIMAEGFEPSDLMAVVHLTVANSMFSGNQVTRILRGLGVWRCLVAGTYTRRIRDQYLVHTTTRPWLAINRSGGRFRNCSRLTGAARETISNSSFVEQPGDCTIFDATGPYTGRTPVGVRSTTARSTPRDQ